MRPRICVPIGKETIKEVVQTIQSLDLTRIDLIEIRVDYLKKLSSGDSLSKIPSLIKVPIIFTYKNTNGKQLNDEFYEKIGASAKGPIYADLDLSTKDLKQNTKLLRQMGIEPIISTHYPSGTPKLTTLKESLEKAVEAGAEICKIVTTAKTLEDNLTCLELIKEESPHHQLVCFAMGPLGTPSRVLSPAFGASFTFASISKGEETAAGQLTVEEMRQIYLILGAERW